jgi:ABC-type nickel/cobalt efflux system permease component RcnA
MQYVQQAAFLVLAGLAIWLFSKNILRIRKNILLGRDEDLTDQSSLRWKNLLLLAFGQKKNVPQSAGRCDAFHHLCRIHHHQY